MNQVKYIFCVGTSLIALTAGPVFAQTSADLTFTGTVARTCVISEATDGSLRLSDDGTTLSSRSPGTAATFKATSTGGTADVTFGDGGLTTTPEGFSLVPVVTRAVSHNGGAESGASTIEVAEGESTFSVHLSAVVSGDIFPIGSYEGTVEVTCSPKI
jgi:hypothetical protein